MDEGPTDEDARAADAHDAPTRAVAPGDDRPSPSIAGRYRLGAVIGSGGVATVYRAHDELLGRDVAVKRLRAGAPDAGRYPERFEREARAAASLNHHDVVQVYDVVDGDGGDRWIVMELVTGGSLAEVIAREAPLAPARALEYARGVADGLGAVHAQGIVHRDVKPHNVLLTESGTPKVADFGISRAEEDPSVTSTGVLLGTPAYLAPEQLSGDPVGPPADVFALGLVLRELLTGERVGGDGPPLEVADRRRSGDITPPSAVVPGIPPAVDALVLRLTARDPEERPADGAAASREIAAAIHELDGGAPAPAAAAAAAPTLVQATSRRRRPAAGRTEVHDAAGRSARRGMLAVGLVVLLVAGTVALFVAANQDGADPPESSSPALEGDAPDEPAPDADPVEGPTPVVPPDGQPGLSEEELEQLEKAVEKAREKDREKGKGKGRAKGRD